MTDLVVYKNNLKQEVGNSSWGDWNEFFRRGSVQHWGGTWMSRNNSTLKILRELGRGDRILAWQSNQGVAVGTATVARVEDDGEHLQLYLKREERFARPVPLHELKHRDPVAAAATALKPGGGALFRTSPEEAAALLRLCQEWQQHGA